LKAESQPFASFALGFFSELKKLDVLAGKQQLRGSFLPEIKRTSQQKGLLV